jgi:hypothetical protein
MNKFLELMNEAVRRDVYNEVNKNVKKPFEILVKVENGNVVIFGDLICNN